MNRFRNIQRPLQELSGALGDLGTFLPLTLGGIAVAGSNPAAVFSMFGLFYLGTGILYRLPVPVQPMKVAAAALLTGSVTTQELSGATLAIGVLLLLLTFSGISGQLVSLIPEEVVAGLQAGLGIMLGFLGLQMLYREPLVGLGTLLVMIPLGFNRLLPQTLIGLAVGFAIKWGMDGVPVFPPCVPSLQIPVPALPAWEDIGRGTFRISLPQLSLTVVNSIILTASLAERYFPGNGRVSPRRLSMTMGIANLLSGFFGGFPMCHGAGGLAGHLRFGARTGFPAILLGSLLLFMGLAFADFGAHLLTLIPAASLGALLFWSSLDMINNCRRPADAGQFFCAASAAILTIWSNAAIALLGGFLLCRLPPWLAQLRTKDRFERNEWSGTPIDPAAREPVD